MFFFYWAKKKIRAMYTHPISTLKNPVKTLWVFMAAWTKFLQEAIWNDLGPNNFYKTWWEFCSFFYWAKKKIMAVYTHPILTWRNPMKPLWVFIAAWTKFLQGAISNDLGPNSFYKTWWGFCSLFIGPKKIMAMYIHPILILKNPVKTLWVFIAAWSTFLQGAIWNDLGPNNFHKTWWEFCSFFYGAKKKNYGSV